MKNRFLQKLSWVVMLGLVVVVTTGFYVYTQNRSSAYDLSTTLPSANQDLSPRILPIFAASCSAALRGKKTASFAEAFDQQHFAAKLGDLSDEEDFVNDILDKNGIGHIDTGCTQVHLTGNFLVELYTKGTSNQYPPANPSDSWLHMKYNLTLTITWLDKNCHQHTQTIKDQRDGWVHIITNADGEAVNVETRKNPPDLSGYTLVERFEKTNVNETRGDLSYCPCKSPSPTAPSATTKQTVE